MNVRDLADALSSYYKRQMDQHEAKAFATKMRRFNGEQLYQIFSGLIEKYPATAFKAPGLAEAMQIADELGYNARPAPGEAAWELFDRDGLRHARRVHDLAGYGDQLPFGGRPVLAIPWRQQAHGAEFALTAEEKREAFREGWKASGADEGRLTEFYRTAVEPSSRRLRPNRLVRLGD